MTLYDFYRIHEDLIDEAFRDKLQKMFENIMELETSELRTLFLNPDFWDVLTDIEAMDGFGTEGMRL